MSIRKIIEGVSKKLDSKNEGRIAYGGVEKEVPFKYTITIPITGMMSIYKYIDSETGEEIPKEEYSSAKVEYDNRDMEKAIDAQLLPLLERVADFKNVTGSEFGSHALIGFGTSLSNKEYMSGDRGQEDKDNA